MSQREKSAADRIGNGAGKQSGKPLGCSLPPRTLRCLTVALRKQWKRYRKGLKRCQENFSEQAVHQSRVETRRLLSIIELLAPLLSRERVKKAKVGLKRHLDTFDDLRDTQVQLQAVKKMTHAFPGARGFYEHLRQREGRLARETRKNIKCIKTRRLDKLIDACRREVKPWRGRERRRAANALLLGSANAAFARTKDLEERIEPEKTETIHCTRVAFKRFRYMVETLAGFLPWATARRLQAMHDYQMMMGVIQDAEVLLREFDKFARKNAAQRGFAGLFRQELERRRHKPIETFLAAAGRLLEFWPVAAAQATGQLALPPCAAEPRAAAHLPEKDGHARALPRASGADAITSWQ